MLVRYEAWFIAPIFYFVGFFRERGKLLRLLASAILPLISCISWLYANYIHRKDALFFARESAGFLIWWRHHVMETLPPYTPIFGLYASLTSYLAPIWYVLMLFVCLTPPVFKASISGLRTYSRKSEKTKAVSLIAAYYLCLVTFFLLTNKSVGWPRHIAPAMPLYIMYTSRYVVANDKVKNNFRLDSFSLRKFLVFSLIFSLVLFAVSVKIGFYAITPHVQAAKWLQEKVGGNEEKIVCHVHSIMILSELPLENFVCYWPGEEADVPSVFDFLEKNNIRYVVSDYGRFSVYFQNFSISFSSENDWIVIYEVG